MTKFAVVLALCTLTSTATAHAQQVDVPRLVNVSGVVTDPTAQAGAWVITFALYDDEQSQTPLWQETQTVQLDGQGNYTVQLGAATQGGLPQNLFTSGQALWLGIRDPAEEPRVQILSVPYALKSSDAETLGGNPASAFVTRDELGASSDTVVVSSDLQITQNLNLPVTGPATGTIYKGDAWFLHTFAGVQGNNTFLGNYAGNFSMGGVNAWDGTANTGIGAWTLSSNTTGRENTALGAMALSFNTIGSGNIAIGDQALYNNTAGSANISIGHLALYQNLTGNYNTAVGHGALQFNLGTVNTAFGDEALWRNTLGGANTAVGAESLWSATTGIENTSMGYQSLLRQTEASYNTSYGSHALSLLTTGSANTVVGAFAGRTNVDSNANVTGGANVWVGFESGPGTSSQLDNSIGIGYRALSTRSNQVVLGNADIAETLLRGNVGIGTNAPEATLEVNGTAKFNGLVTFAAGQTFPGTLDTTTVPQLASANTFTANQTMTGTLDVSGPITSSGNLYLSSSSATIYRGGQPFVSAFKPAGSDGYNTFLGIDAGNLTMGGPNAWLASYNTAVGHGAFARNTTGYNNAALGFLALNANATGFNNAAFGSSALQGNTNGYANTAVGSAALQSNTTGNYNTGLGLQTLRQNISGAGNAGVGNQALNNNTTGNYNTCVGGGWCLWTNTTGSYNSGFGTQALFLNTGGNYNTAIGGKALESNTTGSLNVAVGTSAGLTETTANANVTGSNNVWIGAGAGPGTATQLTNAIAIGYNALNTKANQAVIGNSSVTETLLNGNVGIGTATPAARLDVNGTAKVDSLVVENDDSANAQTLAFQVTGTSFGGSCTMDVSGNFACTGTKSAVVSVDGGARRVALYAVEAPENWFEDYGTGRLTSGSATITLEPVWAQTVNTGMEYHVFLTPKGDCEGLFVANQTPTGFEVRELRRGTSNVEFHYRVIARRKGYETTRLADVTGAVAIQPAMPPK